MLRKTDHFVVTEKGDGILIECLQQNVTPRSKEVGADVFDQMKRLNDADFDACCILDLGIAVFEDGLMMETTPELKLTEERRWELWELAGRMWEDGMTPDAYPNMHDEVWEMVRHFNEDLRVCETDSFLSMWENYAIHELVRCTMRLRSELFSKLRGWIPDTFGDHKPMTGKQAIQYPEIEMADAVLAKYPEIVKFWR